MNKIVVDKEKLKSIDVNDDINVTLTPRKSLFDMTTYLIPSECSIQSFGKQNQLPNFISNFFKQKRGGKRKKRNTILEY